MYIVIMARRRFRRARFRKRKRIFKRKRAVKRYNNTTNVYRVKMRAWADLTFTNATIGTAGTLSFPINFPGYYAGNNWTTPSNTLFDLLPFQSQVRSTMMPLFDSYKVERMKFQFCSRYLDTGGQTTANDLNFYYHYIDPDDCALAIQQNIDDSAIDPTPINQGTGGRRKFITHWVGQTKEGRETWLNVQSRGIAPMTATTSSFNLYPTIYRSLKIFFPNLYVGGATADYLGRVIVDWYVVLKLPV